MSEPEVRRECLRNFGGKSYSGKIKNATYYYRYRSHRDRRVQHRRLGGSTGRQARPQGTSPFRERQPANMGRNLLLRRNDHSLHSPQEAQGRLDLATSLKTREPHGTQGLLAVVLVSVAQCPLSGSRPRAPPSVWAALDKPARHRFAFGVEAACSDHHPANTI